MDIFLGHEAVVTRQLRRVHRALLELRRGVPVVLTQGGAALVVLAAETVCDAGLAEFRASSVGEPVMVLAAGRVADLGIAAAGDQAVALNVGPAALDADLVTRLADPTLAQAVPPGDGVRVVVSPDGATAALRLAKLGRLLPAVLVAPARTNIDGHDLLVVAGEEVLAYPEMAAAALTRAAQALVPLAAAEDARLVAFRPPDGGIEHLAILIGSPEAADAPLARIHSECFTGDLLGSLRCDCGPQLHEAMARMRAEGAGVVLYMAQEGRGIGLANKLRAYALQDRGLDTLDANRALGFRADERNFAPAAVMLRDLGLTRVRLLTNNPAKMSGLAAYGIDVVGREALSIAANGVNDRYLATKAARFGHLIG